MATKVMIVDDDSASRREWQRQLQGSAGFEVGACVGADLEAIKTAEQQRPDFVLLSVEEPAARPIRVAEGLTVALPALPIVAVSSLSDREHMRRAVLAGARDYLVKPVSAEELLGAVAAVLELEEKKRVSAGDGQRAASSLGQVISVYGAKGGVGKTVLAVNLAASLVLEAGQRVVVVDLDTQFGDVAVTLDVLPDRTIGDLARVVDKLDAEMVESYLTRHQSGVQVLAAPLHIEESENVTAACVAKIIQVLRSTYDVVIIDLPSWLHDPVLAAMEQSSVVMLVTNTDVSSLKSVRLLLNALRAWNFPEEKIKLVVNHSVSMNGVPRADVGEVLGWPVYWEIPFDAGITGSTKQGYAYVQVKKDSRTARNVIDLALALTATRRTQSKGLLGRWRR